MPRFPALLLLAFPFPAFTVSAQQLSPPGTGGIAAIDQALSRLGQNKRVLLIGAHPDDEDTELLTLLSRGMGVDAAYLSLSRGEGGQNLIGTELGEALGLIRTGELLAARSVDGARQYFSRGFDFGFSKTLDETLRFWPRAAILEDVLRVVRRFKPQIIVAVFSGTPRDGHGQHQMSGVMAQEVFALLRDSAWGPRKLYRSARFDPTGTTTILPSGMLDPVTGRSVLQIAMAGRSQHRSQDMGQIQRLGSSTIRLQLMARADGRAPSTEASLFEGIDTALTPALTRYGVLIDSARSLLSARAPETTVPILIQALTDLRAHADPFFLAQKEPALQEALAAAAGIVMDAWADDRFIARLAEMPVASIAVWAARGIRPHVDTMDLVHRAQGGRSGIISDSTVAGVRTRRIRFRPLRDDLTLPYFLLRPRVRGLYDWSAVPDSLRGEPLDPPEVTAFAVLDIGGVKVRLEREVAWRSNDQAVGEVRKPLAVVPPVSISMRPSVLLWPAVGGSRTTLIVELTRAARDSISGEVVITTPEGWPQVPPQPFTLAGEGAQRSLRFTVRAPQLMRPGRYQLVAEVRHDRGSSSVAAETIDYPHVRPVTFLRTAQTRIEAVRLALPRLRMVGYVRGASDAVPEALEAVGVPITLLDADALEQADFSRFDVMVIGSRAYETEPALVANNARLLDWVRAGGRLIVQYQQYQFVQGGLAPFQLTIGRPHDRVTDEESPVVMLVPSHPLFRTPNPMGPQDWADWWQERGLYFAREWDPAYRPLLEMGDGADRLRGGMLVARLGSGLYVYTGVAFFRQLPAAVPGAFKLFLNLLGLEASNVP